MKIAMILSPSEQVMYDGVIALPPHSLGVVTAYMRGLGNVVHQYDLNTDLQDSYLNTTLTREEMKIVYNKNAVIGYLNGEENPAITRYIEKLLAGIPMDSFDLVGISTGGTFCWMAIHTTFLIAKYIKKRYKIPVVIGGNNIIYLTAYKKEFNELWQSVLKSIRFIIIGAGLESFRKITERLKDNPGWVPSPNERNEIKGLIYLENGNLFHISKDKDKVTKPDFKGLRLDYYMNFLKNPAKSSNPTGVEKQNLEQVYKWPWDLVQLSNKIFRKKEKKKKDDFIKKLVIPYIFQYHCPYSCAFCSESAEGNHLVLGDPIQAVNDIEALLQEYDTPYIKFFNNYFNLSKKFTLAFCEEIKRRKLKFYWSDCARFTGLSFDLLKKYKESGCQALWFGMESASVKMLKMINKKINPKHMDEGLEFCRQLGIWANIEVIVSLPHENLDDFRKTVLFLKRNADKINNFMDNRYYVIPDSIIGRYPEKFGIQLEKELISYDLVMKSYLKWFLSDKGMEARPISFNMYPFNEVGGRRYNEIFQEGLKRQRYLQRFRKKEFYEIRQMFLLMESLENPTITAN